MTTNEMLAYIAGFFDGEGCFMLNNSNIGNPTATIEATNTDEEVINFMADFLAVIGIRCKLYNSLNSHKHCMYKLRIAGNKSMLKFCLLMKPYLVVKSKHCILMLAFLNIASISGRDANVFGKEKAALAATVKGLNRKEIVKDDLQNLELGALG